MLFDYSVSIAAGVEAPVALGMSGKIIAAIP